MVVYVRGVGRVKVGDIWDKSVLDLARDAASLAMEDANVSKIDYVVVSNMTSLFLNAQGNLATALIDLLNIRAIPITVESACGSGGFAVSEGFRLVKSGARNVLIVGVEKMSDAVTQDVTTAMMMAEDREYTAISGISFVGLNALALDYYLKKFNVLHDDIMMLPVIDHEHASLNPYAQFPYKITLEKVKNSPPIVDPLRLLESSGIGDGAAAVILSSEKGDVEISASETAVDKFRLTERSDPLWLMATDLAARKAYEASNLSPNDIDIVEIHDAFSITGVLSLEDLGFAKKGEGAKLVSSGDIRLNGKLPTNTFGGLKARGHPVGATGVYQVVEIALQLRGDAGENQVDGAKIGLAQNAGAVATSVSVTILEKV